MLGDFPDFFQDVLTIGAFHADILVGTDFVVISVTRSILDNSRDPQVFPNHSSCVKAMLAEPLTLMLF